MINIKGNRIKLVNTIDTEINQIINLEKLNNEFVEQYSKNEHFKIIENPNFLHLTIKHRESKRLIGYIIVAGVLNKNKSLEFRRIVINEKGKGFGREAVQLLKKVCFEELQFHKLWLDVYDSNTRAIKLYESESFKKEGTIRKVILTKKKGASLLIYSMLKSE